MSSTTERLDPEVGQIIQEIVGDPRSCLTRVPAKPLRDLSRREAPISATATILSVPERHLLLVHRERVALLLSEACKRSLFTGSYARHLARKVAVDHEVEIADEEDWERRAGAEARIPFATHEREHALLVALANKNNELPEATALAQASLCLAPSDATRVCLGMALLTDSSPRAALRVFEDVLAHTRVASYRAHAYSNAGHTWTTLGNLEEARKSCRAAANAAPDLPGFTIPWMTSSIWVGAREDALEAANRLEAFGSRATPVIEEYQEALRPENQIMALPKEGRKLIRNIQDYVSSSARKILNVIT